LKEITVIAKNKVGTLAQVAEALGGLGVNIETISAYESSGKAVFRIITNDSTSAIKALSKVPDSEIKEAQALIYKMSNRPGELGKLSKRLAEKGINLEGLYILSRYPDYTEVVVRPASSDLDRTKELLNL
jgi:hypothetical protein